ncbi:MAG TPA: hypothetical protein VML96_07605 [Egibacteraceae bacterium]|nr:hypothetical protein [Egibacteraceae bacterium]
MKGTAPSGGAAMRRLAATAILALAVSCAARAATPAPLARLATEQEAYDGRLVRTEGVVVAIAGTAGQHFVLEDASANRVRLLPDDIAQDHAGQAVTVVGGFRFHPDRGRELTIDDIAPLSPP